MNIWTERSIDLASNFNYLDQLFKVYPMSVNPRRKVDPHTINSLNVFLNKASITCPNTKDNEEIIKILLSEDLFPIKDSYVAYLRRDPSAISRNPQTINRIASIICEMGFNNIMDAITQPKETNRQIGPMFKDWVSRTYLGADEILNIHFINRFMSENKNFILIGSDAELEKVANDYLGYYHSKGVDFIAKFNGTYVLGEAKFLTDFGGHQNAQMNDALAFINAPLTTKNYTVKPIAILDGVNYIRGNNKLFLHTVNNSKQDILSSLLLRDYLHSL